MLKLALCSDSNGTNAYVIANQIYGKLIADHIGATFTNYSVSTKRSDEIISFVSSAISAGNDIIIINAGTNNFSQNYSADPNTVISAIVADVKTMIDNCQAANIKPIVMSPILPNDIQQFERHIELGNRLAYLCANEGVDYVPVAETMAAILDGGSPSWSWTVDGYHGLANWHLLVANLVINRQYAVSVLPPSSPVVLLNIVNGIDTSTFSRAITLVGNTFVDSSPNAGFLRFDGVNDRAILSDSADWAFSSDNFTIEIKVKYNTLGGFLLIQRSGSGDYLLFYNDGTTTYFQVVSGTTIILNAQFTWVPSTGTVYDLKLERIGTSFKFYVNGSQVGSTVTSSVSIPDYSAALSIGEDSFSGSGDFNGWINNIKITRG